MCVRAFVIVASQCLLGFLFSSFCFVCASELSFRDKMDIVNLHNGLRKLVATGLFSTTASNMKLMRWSSDLQKLSEKSINCSGVADLHQFDHEAKVNTDVTTGSSIYSLMFSWITEGRHFSPQFGACLPPEKCLHFIKMINAKHHEVGCAISDTCRTNGVIDDYRVVQCRYSHGDVIFPAYKSGPACSQCDDQTPFCKQGLCVKCDNSKQECDCRKTCQKENIGHGFLDARTCTCTCQYGLGPNCDEDCVNPKYYEDWDICAMITTKECTTGPEEDQSLLAEMCPASCLCRRHPNSTSTVGRQ